MENIDIRFGEHEESAVLSNFSLEVASLDKIAIIGETGSGKSVLIQAILGLLPAKARITGTLLYKNEDLLKLSRSEWNRIRGNEISYVPQGSGSSMNPLLSVGFQVAEPLLVHKKIERAGMMDKAIELLRIFNIGDEEARCRQYPHTYSGGMKQRALIAMGISAGAQLILADEPTKGLDGKRIELVKNSFRLLEDKAYICVTHDLDFARAISKRLCILYSSELLEEGDTQEIFSDPYHPYTRDIINAMPEKGLRCHHKSMSKNIPKAGCKYSGKCLEASELCCKAPPPIVMKNNRRVRCWKYAESR